jgi:uncharacterized protein YkwD
VCKAHPLRAAIVALLGCALLAIAATAVPALASSGHLVRHNCPAKRSRSAVIGRSTRTCTPTTHGVRRKAAVKHSRTVAIPVQSAAAAPKAPPSPAATIAAVLATPCQNTTLTPEPANLPLLRAAVLCLINRVRAEHAEAPLRTNADLERAAEEHSRELVADDYFAHVSPSGFTPVDRIRETGYIPGPSFGYVIGENLAWGTLSLATPQAIVEAWVASPGHLANILEAQYQDTGIGIVAAVPPSLAGGEQGATYAQEFGVILG